MIYVRAIKLHNFLGKITITFSSNLELSICAGSPIRHIESARHGREKGGRWSISGFFRKKSRKTSGSESDLTLENDSVILGRSGECLPPRPPGDYFPPPPRPPKRSEPGGNLFPHLTAEYLYPAPSPATQGGYYFHHNFGYVKQGILPNK